MLTIHSSKSEAAGSWHTGENMNVPEGYVIVFQADGHELSWLLGCIAKGLGEEGLRLNYPAQRLTPVL